MAERRGKTVMLNCVIDKQLKTRVDIFAATNEIYLWQLVESALKEYLEKHTKEVM